MEWNIFGSAECKKDKMASSSTPPVAHVGFYFTGDAHTGLYRPVDSNLALETGGVEGLRVDERGRVGIGGVKYPLAPLHVGGNLMLSGALLAATRGSASAAAYSFVGDPGTGLYGGNAAPGGLALASRGRERLRICAQTGFVSVGDAPAGHQPSQALDVQGNLRFSQQAMGPSPSSGTAAASAPAFSWAASPSAGMFSPYPNTVAFATRGEERLRLAQDGRVGIGTLSPSALLHVEGDAFFASNLSTSNALIAREFLHIDPAGVLSRLQGRDAARPGSLLIGNGSNAYRSFSNLEWDSTSNLLRLRGDVELAADQDSYVSVPTSNSLSLRTDAVDRVRITPGGQVGVGSNHSPDPQFALDVLGSIFASGDVVMNSDARSKTDVTVIPDVLERLALMRGVTYRKKNDPRQRGHVGLLAHEVQAAFPEAVTESSGADRMLSVAYPNLVGVLVEGVNTLARTLRASESKRDVQLEQLVRRIEELERA